MNAATGELQRIEALMHLTRVGDIPPEEAQEMLARLRETQLRRRGMTEPKPRRSATPGRRSGSKMRLKPCWECGRYQPEPYRLQCGEADHHPRRSIVVLAANRKDPIQMSILTVLLIIIVVLLIIAVAHGRF
jgi:hypothetical protein